MNSNNPVTNKYGVSFSLKQCRNFDLDWRMVLAELIDDLGVKRFRLMSYWDEHEKSPGNYDFSELDAQIVMIAAAGGEVSLCLGVRQPRWPENHWPDWAWVLPAAERNKKLLQYVEILVKRYANEAVIVSYQLENEALLHSFGERPDVDRVRLLNEFALVKSLDPTRPIIMTTSTSWGIPFNQPIPDIVGFSYYQVLYRDGKYRLSFHRPWLDKVRRGLINLFHGKPSFIHELQAEPWGPKNIWEMNQEEQFKSMSLEQLKENIRQAQATNLFPIDLWGAEWWYWRKTKHRDPSFWNAVHLLFERD
jgi:hypothetical protein